MYQQAYIPQMRMVISVCLPEAGCKFAFFCHAVFQDWAPDHSIDISLKFSLNSFLITSMLQIMDKDRQLTCELPLWMFTPLLAVIHVGILMCFGVVSVGETMLNLVAFFLH